MPSEDLKQSLKLYIVLSRALKAINETTHQLFQDNGLNQLNLLF